MYKPRLKVQPGESLCVCEFPGRLHVLAMVQGAGRNITAEVATVFSLPLEEHGAIALAQPPVNGVYTPADDSTVTALSLQLLLMEHTDAREVTYDDMREMCAARGVK